MHSLCPQSKHNVSFMCKTLAERLLLLRCKVVSLVSNDIGMLCLAWEDMEDTLKPGDGSVLTEVVLSCNIQGIPVRSHAERHSVCALRQVFCCCSIAASQPGLRLPLPSRWQACSSGPGNGCPHKWGRLLCSQAEQPFAGALSTDLPTRQV